MARVLREAAITTRNARTKLSPGLHWRGIDPDTHLGYRKGKRGGIWLVRWRHGKGYRQAPIGSADDALDEGTLDFSAAVRAGRSVVEAERAAAKAAADGPLLTVRSVVEGYVAEQNSREGRRRGRDARSPTASRMECHVLGREPVAAREQIEAAPLAGVALHLLKESDLISWRSALPKSLKATTGRRVINDLKAALNGAYAMNRKRLDPTFPATVKHGLHVEAGGDDADRVARDNQILTDAQVGRLLSAAREIDAEDEWDGDLFRLIVVLAALGARFSQVARMQVRDVQPERGRLMVPSSRKGKGNRGSTAVPVGADVLDTLVPAVTGRKSDALLLERWRFKRIPGTRRWERAGRGGWGAASELRLPWGSIRERAKMPDVIPYALRHSSIVRGIRSNLPIRLVAALHDTSVPMIERHYGRWVADGLDELAARAVVPLVPKVRE